MIYKTLEDLERVISLGKSQAVIDKFAESYLKGVALRPYFEAEKEYLKLTLIEDVPDVETTYDELENVLQEGYSPNDERDKRIEGLVSQYPYLVTPEAELVERTVEVLDNETGELTQEIELQELPIPSLDLRRPIISDLNYELIRTQLRTYKKKKRDDTLAKATVTTANGNTFDADEISQGRMSRAILTGQAVGLTETYWTLANNESVLVGIAEMVEALALSMQKQGELWVS